MIMQSAIIQTGCDIVSIDRIKKSINSSGTVFLDHIFTSHELKIADGSSKSLAGIFAAKEAVIKCLSNHIVLNWKDIQITKNINGRPQVTLIKNLPNLKNIDISISHDGDYAIANAVAFILEI
jgi:holo-[acyl-carrier protein] synthase